MKKLYSKIRVSVFTLVLVVFLFPRATEASVLRNLSTPCLECGNCTTQDLAMAGGNIFNFFIYIIGSVVLLVFFIGGLVLLISHGNRRLEELGRSIINGSVKGLAISILCWVIVNFVITAMVQDREIFGKEWFSFPESPPFACTPPPQLSLPSQPSINWTLAGGVDPRQIQDASPELAALLNCMYQKEPNLIITSISDNDLYTGNCNIQNCNKQKQQSGGCPANVCSNDAQCVHRCGSCHYAFGTAQGTNFSRAADFRLNVESQVVARVARECDPGMRVEYEADHTHISHSSCPR